MSLRSDFIDSPRTVAVGRARERVGVSPSRTALRFLSPESARVGESQSGLETSEGSISCELCPDSLSVVRARLCRLGLPL